MMEHAEVQTLAVAKPKPFETGMRCHGGQRAKHQMKDYVHRMTRNNKMDQHGPEIHQMFYGVHRQTRPRADICITVMQSVKPVQRIDMQEAVYPIEIETLPNRNKEKNRHKPNWITGN